MHIHAITVAFYLCFYHFLNFLFPVMKQACLFAYFFVLFVTEKNPFVEYLSNVVQTLNIIVKRLYLAF